MGFAKFFKAVGLGSRYFKFMGNLLNKITLGTNEWLYRYLALILDLYQATDKQFFFLPVAETTLTVVLNVYRSVSILFGRAVVSLTAAVLPTLQKFPPNKVFFKVFLSKNKQQKIKP